ncbi:MAG: NlpC/P60 family protein [Rhodothermales bacterium]
MKSVSIGFAGVLMLMPGLSLAESGRIAPDEIRPGDLLFFWINDQVRHVGIYLEDGVFFHASTTAGVTLSNLNEDYWRYRLISVRRVQHNISLKELRQDFSRYDPAGYRYGSTGPKQYDCSGLVWRVFGSHGVELPRTTRAQIRAGSLVISGRNYLLTHRRS